MQSNWITSSYNSNGNAKNPIFFTMEFYKEDIRNGHFPKIPFLKLSLYNTAIGMLIFYILTSLCSWTDLFESYLARNSKDRFSYTKSGL